MVPTADSFRDISEIKNHLSNISSSDNADSANADSHEQLLKPEFMLLRQRLQTLCRNVLLNNLEAALDMKIETDLWNFAFKAQITSFQQARQVKSSNTKRAEIQADYTLFLENALGFYIQLLEDICETFHLHPHFRRKYSSFGIIQGRSEQSKRSQSRTPSRTSSMYICQYCLVHLGDIARYLPKISLAENFYNLAARYVPSNGQPYNQLAILCSSRSNKLAIAYYYIRSIAVRSPFPVAPTNLEKLYSKQVKECENTNFISKNKWTHTEVITAFIYLQSLVHLETDKEKASKISELLCRCVSSHTIFSLLTAQNMYHMVVISIFTLSHIDDTGGDDSITEDERHFRDVVVTFIAGILEAMTTQAQKYNVREHATLSNVKVILDWLIYREGYLSNGVLKNHRCWLSLAKLLNAIQSHCKDVNTFDLSKWELCPLPEDVELRCFLPLSEAHEKLDFNLVQNLKIDSADVTRLRCKRLVELGKTLTEKYPSLNIIDYKANSKNTKTIFSAPTAIKVEPTRRKTANRNVAIQALQSQESSPSTSTTSLTAATLSDPVEDVPSWPLAPSSTFSLTSTPESSYAAGLDKVSSYSSFQSDMNAVVGAVRASPNLSSFGLVSQATGSQATGSEELLPGSQSQMRMISSPPRPVTSQGAIGSQLGSKSRTVAELMESTCMVDPVLQPMKFSASDSSVFSSQGQGHTSGYSLFSPTFPLPVSTAAGDVSTGEMMMPIGSGALSAGLSSPSVWPSANNQSAGLESAWGNKSALAQLLEEQQKRHQVNKQLKEDNS